MQRTILAAVHATEERLIAPCYMIQISANLAFSYTKRELIGSKSTCCHILDASHEWIWFAFIFLLTKIQ